MKYRILCCFSLLPLLLNLGCNSNASLDGYVTFKEDGTPFVGGRVIFNSEERQVSATGATDENGYYSLGATRPGDGLPPGRYKVLIAPPLPEDPDNPTAVGIHKKYTRFESSGLICEVEEGTNRFDVQVEHPD